EEGLAEPIVRVRGPRVARVSLEEIAKALLGERIILAQHIAIGEVELVARGGGGRQGRKRAAGGVWITGRGRGQRARPRGRRQRATRGRSSGGRRTVGRSTIRRRTIGGRRRIGRLRRLPGWSREIEWGAGRPRRRRPDRHAARRCAHGRRRGK